MRKILFILLPLLALIALFAIYFRMQPKFNLSAADKKSVDQFSSTGSGNNAFIMPGSGAWVKQFDRDGKLFYQFKSQYYDPQPDGMVKVTHPVIQFFLSEGQVLQIEGNDGTIRFSPGADKGVMSNSPTDPPRYGNLRVVTVRLLSSPSQPPSDADMTMTMANAQFDNDTYRLFTQEYVDTTGKTILADQVPVTIRAKDYSFDGTGLVLYWNDLDKRLKSLEIAHGTDLTVLNASEFSTQAPPTNPTVASPTVQTPAPTPPPSEAPTTRHRYLARFFDNVRVIQAGEEVVRSSEMDVDFATKGQSNSATDNSSTPSSPTDSNSTAPASSSPTTAPASQPIHIHWTGIMRMVSLDDSASQTLADGKAIIHLVGSPVYVHQTATDRKQTIDARCADLQYRTADSSALLTGNVVLKQTKADGVVSTVLAQSLNFSKATHTAVFDGQGHAILPDPNDPKSVLKAAWDRRCQVHLYDLDKSQMQIERADLTGNVIVDHPRFQMTAKDNVALQFDVLSPQQAHASSSPPLRKVTATGNAICIIHEANQKTRHISGQQLQLLRDPGPDGKLYAKTVLCDGSVLAEQDNQNLKAEHLKIDLLPTTRKSAPGHDLSADDLSADVALDMLTATTNVLVTGKDSSTASADKLEMKMIDDHPHITLTGSTDHNAQVKNKTSTLSGPIIHLSPHDQTALIDGPGTFDGLQQPKDPSQTPRPMKLTWQTSASLDGKINQGLVIGNVVAVSAAPGSTHDSAKSDRILVTLVDLPPTTRPAPKSPATQPADSDLLSADDSDFMKNKQIKTLSLLMDPPSSSATTRPVAPVAIVESYLQDADGNLLRQTDLLSNRIDYQAADKRLAVHGPGFIYASENPPTTRPATNPAAPDNTGNGITRIHWEKQFIYDDAGHSAVIEGNVKINHLTTGPKPQAIEIQNADIVQAELEAAPASATRPTTDDDAAARRIKRVTAAGPMKIVTTDKTIWCGEIDYNAAGQTLTCLAGQLGQVTIVDASNLDSGTCSQAIIDIKTNQIIKMTNVKAHGR